MTRLLVSVRNAVEAVAAVEAGADLIDVKEPARGSLGAADSTTIRSIVEAVAGRRTVSAALGELRDWNSDNAAELPATLSFAKLGLAGCAAIPDWSKRWRRCMQAFPSSVQPVAVVYADWQIAGSPDPYTIADLAASFGCTTVLVDTFDKSAGGLLDHWPLAELARFVELLRHQKRLIVLAGSLTFASIEQVLPLEPDFVAVRGAVCAAGRSGTLDPAKVCRLASRIREKYEVQSTKYEVSAKVTRAAYET